MTGNLSWSCTRSGLYWILQGHFPAPQTVEYLGNASTWLHNGHWRKKGVTTIPVLPGSNYRFLDWSLPNRVYGRAPARTPRRYRVFRATIEKETTASSAGQVYQAADILIINTLTFSLLYTKQLVNLRGFAGKPSWFLITFSATSPDPPFKYSGYIFG